MTRRRAAGEGTITHRKDGRWEGALTVGATDAGNPKRRRVYGRTRAAVLAKIDALRVEASTTGIIAPDTMTVAGLVDLWLEAKGRTCRDSTLDNYRTLLRVHVTPELGELRVQRLTALRIHAHLAALAASGSSVHLVRYVWHLLRGLLDQAVRWRVIPANPALEVVAPAKPRRRPHDLWTPDEVRAVLAAATTSRTYAAIVLALTCGLRRGEVLGLRCSDYDAERGLLTVRRTVVVVKNQAVTGEPKTDRGYRSLYLPADARAALEARLAAVAAERKHAIEEEVWTGGDDPYVFGTPIGAPTHPRNFLRAFTELVATAKVRRIRFHDLRHAYATMALARVPLPTLSARLGHHAVSFTLDAYTEELPGDDVEAAIPLAELLDRGRSAN